MTVVALERDSERVADLLRRHARDLVPVGPACWTLTVGDHTPEIRTQLKNKWLEFEAVLEVASPPAKVTAEQMTDLLIHNRDLKGGVKFALDPESRHVRLIAEIPWNADVDSEEAIAAVFAGLCQGRDRAHSAEQTEQLTSVSADAAAVTGLGERVAKACQEGGWETVVRGDGRIVVQLDVPDAFCQAVFAVDPKVAFAVDLGLAPAHPTSRSAVAVLLLQACSLVRLARAIAKPVGDTVTFAWEVSLNDTRELCDLEPGLVALSMACRLTLRELSALQDERDERIAAEYLRLRGWLR